MMMIGIRNRKAKHKNTSSSFDFNFSVANVIKIAQAEQTAVQQDYTY